MLNDFIKDSEMVKRAKQGGDSWSMQTDRELIVLSKTKTLEALADHFRRPHKSILEKAKRLGLPMKRTAKTK